MDSMKFESPDFIGKNVDKLAELFPSVVTESKNKETGKLQRTINFDMLRTILGSNASDGESYEFTWVGKKEAVIEASKPIRKTLRPSVTESKNWQNTENLYIEGDNLDVLKLLQDSYLGKVNLIYIDPPYNTGNDFVYKDNFSQSKEDYEASIGVHNEQGERLFCNTESNGRFHSDWCSMMYPRLVLARNLLCDDGLIFISIDDNEVHNLRKICDEIFGESNFRNQIIIRRGAKSVQAQFETWDKLGQGFEYILLYSKSQLYRFPKQMKALSEAKAGTWNNHWRGTDRPTMRYPLLGITPPTGQWRWSKERSEVAVKNYQTMLSELGETNETVSAQQIDQWYVQQQDANIDLLRLSKTGKPEHYLAPTNETLLNSSWMDLLVGSSSEISSLFDTTVFDTAKLISPIKRVLQFCSKDATILDFFSGSASTAHAVMQQNVEDGGKRKFIMVQLPEQTNEKSEARKVGYPNICEVGKERIRRAGDKIKKEHKANPNIEHLDVGFRVLKLDDSNMQDVYYSAAELTQSMLMNMESNIKSDRTDMDLLYGCLIEWGLPLSQPHTTQQIDGATVHIYNHDDLIACFADKISKNLAKTIAGYKPQRVVFKEDSFSSSAEKINIEELFKLYTPYTTVHIL